MKMYKIFISQPMKGKTDEEILKEREEGIELAKRLVGDNIIIMDTFFQGMPKDAKPLQYLAKSLDFLSQANFALFLGDWQNFRGCKIEYMCAKEYGIDILNIVEE